VDVSFLLRCQGSRLAPREGAAILLVGGVSSDPANWARQPHTNSPAHKEMRMRGNKRIVQKAVYSLIVGYEFSPVLFAA